MKKRVSGRKLSRERDSRRALFRGLVWQLVEHGGITTTKAKAKAIQPMVDKLVKLAGEDATAAKRRAYAILGNKSKVAKKLFTRVGPALAKRGSGFTRITNLGQRKGDMAEMVRLEWVEEISESKPEKPAKSSKKTKAKTEKKAKKK